MNCIMENKELIFKQRKVCQVNDQEFESMNAKPDSPDNRQNISSANSILYMVTVIWTKLFLKYEP